MLDHSHPKTKLANFREVRGSTLSGLQVAPRKLFRSDDLSTIDEMEAERIASLGISLIVDLRSVEEVENLGRGPLENFSIDYLHLPLLVGEMANSTGMQLPEMEFTNEMLGLWYAKVAQTAAEVMAEGFSRIAEQDSAVVFHCAVGKDRTGVFAAGLQETLGVSRQEIIEDFERTNERLPQVLARLADSQPMWSEDVIKRSGALLRADAAAIETMFANLDAQFGGLGDLLASRGLTSELREELRGKFLVPS